MKAITRSPKLRPERPFQINRVPWFGASYLNGPCWSITIRRGDHYLTCRVGGWDASIADAVEYARECRAKDRKR